MLIILPNIALIESSFRPYLPLNEIDGPRDSYTLANYQRFLSTPVGFDIFGMSIDVPIHLRIFITTVLYSIFVTAIILIIGYPAAYYMTKTISPSNMAIFFIVLTVPMWVSEILRSFAWFTILSFKGPLNALLIEIGVINSEVRWIRGYYGIIIGLVYTYMLFMVFPLYSSMQSLDKNQIEAAQDLGASWWRTHWRVIVPHCKPGIVSGCVMVFMLSAGSLLVPSLLGSPNSLWFTQTIQQLMLEALDWNTGAAYSLLFLSLCTFVVVAMMWAFKVKLSDITN
ncbi:ABC transporter permease [Mesorhizobium amorphae]|uniref:ABC transporter permease n=1 Tax=Mesorhizobium amorphae TaxID=71433 RepID=UPI00177C9ADC|nr:ABC transporter permease [Mesorhizobium amorphae]